MYPSAEIKELARENRYQRRLMLHCLSRGSFTLRQASEEVKAKKSKLTRAEREYLMKMVDENHPMLDRDFSLEPDKSELNLDEILAQADSSFTEEQESPAAE